MTSIGICMLFITMFSVIFNGLRKLFLHKGPLTLLGMDLSFPKSEDSWEVKQWSIKPVIPWDYEHITELQLSQQNVIFPFPKL